MYINSLLKQIREEKKLSLEELSRISSVSTTHLNDIERNKKEATATILFKISKALSVKIEELYEVKW